MTKKEMKKKLLEAGIPEEVVDERLKDMSDETLKEYKDIPEAVLKEMKDAADKQDDDDSEEGFVLDDSVLKEIADKVEERVSTLLDGLTIEIAESKESEAITELKELVEALSEKVDKLLETDGEKIRKEVQDQPRANKLRIRRFKQVSKEMDGKKKRMMDDEDMADDEDEDYEDGEEEEKEATAAIVGADGTQYTSMTDLVLGPHQAKSRR